MGILGLNRGPLSQQSEVFQRAVAKAEAPIRVLRVSSSTLFYLFTVVVSLLETEQWETVRASREMYSGFLRIWAPNC